MNGKAWIVGCMAFALGMLGVVRVAMAKDETVSLDQTPAKVKSAIEKEVEGGKINKIEKDEYKGKTVYEVEYTDDGEVEEAAFTEDGKSVDEDDDDSSDDEDKDSEDEDSQDEDSQDKD